MRPGASTPSRTSSSLIRAVGDTFAALDVPLEELAIPGLRPLAELSRQAWSYDRLAAAAPLSKDRIGQLVAEARPRRF